MRESPQSSRQPLFVVQELAVVHGPSVLGQTSCTVPSDGDQAAGKAALTLAAHSLEPLPDSFCHCRRHALAGQLREFLSEAMRFIALDVQAHELPFYHWLQPHSHGLS